MGIRFRGLSLVGNTWTVRKGVPADVRERIGKRELLKSLQTGDEVEARRFYPGVWADFDQIIATARAANAADAGSEQIDLKEIDRLIAQWLLAEHRVPGAQIDDLTTPWFIQRDIDLYTAAMADPGAWRNILNIDADVVALMASLGVTIRPEQRPFPEVRKMFIRAHKLLFEHREKERLARAWSQRSREATTGAPPPQVIMGPKPSHMTVQSLYEEWVSKVAKPVAKERGRLDHQMRRLIEFLGGDRPINLISKTEVGDFLAMLARYPTRRSTELHALSFGAVITKFEADVAKLAAENEVRTRQAKAPLALPQTLTKNTVEGWYGSYRRMFHHAVATVEGFDTNPFDGLAYMLTGSQSQKRRAFSDEEIAALFHQSRFQGDAKGADFWLPVLSLLHGSRMSELAALPLSAFKVGKCGQQYFDLEDQQVKNEGSERLIPLHPDAIAGGFLDYVEALREAGEHWLFPDLDHENPQGPGHEFSKQWGRWMTKIGMTDPSVTFHSFRHTWKRRARASPVKEEIHDVLSGHASTTISRKYGEGLDVSDLAKNMALIEFPTMPKVKVGI